MSKSQIEFSGFEIPPLEVAENKAIILEQYKITIESIKSHNEIRESSNNFWVTIHPLALSGVAYMRDAAVIPNGHKSFVLWMLILFGLALCLVWTSYLQAINKQIDIKNKMLMEYEKYLPTKPFTNVFFELWARRTRDPLTLREVGVPLLFLMGYFLLAITLLFFPQEVVAQVP